MKTKLSNLRREMIFGILPCLLMIVATAIVVVSSIRAAHPKHTFACAINCMDGRTQDAVKDYMKASFHVDYVDVITEPGPCKILAENLDQPVIEDIKKRLRISVQYHQSQVIAIVAHDQCAGNPLPKEEQIVQLKKSREIIRNIHPDKKVILLWIDQTWSHAELIE